METYADLMIQRNGKHYYFIIEGCEKLYIFFTFTNIKGKFYFVGDGVIKNYFYIGELNHLIKK